MMTAERIPAAEPDNQQAHPVKGSKSVIYLLNGIIVLLAAVVAFLVYTTFFQSSRKEKSAADNQPARIIQLDVLNGRGVPGSAAHVTDILRQRGFDVVEVKNYFSFGIPGTIVIDRTGDRVSARKVAAALGVDEQNIVEQINPDYFVDVSVVVGKDYSDLKPSQITIPKEKD
jgi:hypothetical protein